MRSFIAGGAGFIGSHMAAALMERGPVTVYDNLSSGSLEHLKAVRSREGFRFLKGEVGDLESLRRAMAGHDLVVHLASNPDIARSMVETDLDLREGTLLTYNILEAMRLTGVPVILYASGSGVYGDVGLVPTPEDFGPLLPISLYGASKLAGEGMISAFSHMFGLRGFIFRFANVVGARQTHGVGYDFIRKLDKNPKALEILGDGSQSKSYIHVSDVVRAMLHVLDRSRERLDVFNIATGDYIDVGGIAAIVIEEMGLAEVELDYTGGDRGWKGDVPKVRFVLDKIFSLGWRPCLNSAEAIRNSVREMLEEEEENGRP
ncbi:MAG TPA: NAD-dependent epimerase/dehydratase family protein [bacterium]|nr:NAD-dependent epimerase/dehydratase family protein [bacterium]HPJ71075.1 NAD-dependent epimerase/dehydratase family protein [bacterium]HPQ65185.1 NAD-dependent epimerase/dehydratase family protein [bacterium]